MKSLPSQSVETVVSECEMFKAAWLQLDLDTLMDPKLVASEIVFGGPCCGARWTPIFASTERGPTACSTRRACADPSKQIRIVRGLVVLRESNGLGIADLRVNCQLAIASKPLQLSKLCRCACNLQDFLVAPVPKVATALPRLVYKSPWTEDQSTDRFGTNMGSPTVVKLSHQSMHDS